MSTTTTTPTIYFGYGSNLWLRQMHIRCRTSKYLGVARLNNYRWIINDRGYANVVEIPAEENQQDKSKYTNLVFGMVYALEPSDEKHLDRNEGVPVAYTKEILPCDFWPATSTHDKIDTEITPPKETRGMLVYIDRVRTTPDEPRKEYIYRMNQGIADALMVGVPEGYVEDVMREFIPAEEGGEGRKSLEEFATKQAAQFKDESGVFE